MRTARSRPKQILPAGTTLLEGIIAIGVIITAVVGSLVLIMTTIKLGRANQDRVVAQNLAKEGVELAVSLRNSASLMRASDASISWDVGLVGYRWSEYNDIEYLDIGTDIADLYQTTGSYKFCFQRGAGMAGNCTPSNITRCDDWDYNDTNPLLAPVPGSGGEGEINRCDIIPLVNYIFAGWEVPPLCEEYWAIYGLGAPKQKFKTSVACDYTQDGRIDISDVVYIVNALQTGTHHFTTGFPRISVSRPIGNGLGEFGIEMYYSPSKPIAGIFDSTPAWNDAKARIHLVGNTYVQNSELAGQVPTKYYRLVSAREVCRNTADSTQEIIIPENYVYGCEQYTAQLAPPWSSTKVGAFVTSEVRWPTPTSSTKAVYQTYIYDWLAL